MAIVDRPQNGSERLPAQRRLSERLVRGLGALTHLGRQRQAEAQVPRTPEVPVSPETLGRLERICSGVWSSIDAATPANAFRGHSVERTWDDNTGRELVTITQTGVVGSGKRLDTSLRRGTASDGAEVWVISQKAKRAGLESDPSFSHYVETDDITVDETTATTQSTELVRPANRDEIIYGGPKTVTELRDMADCGPLTESRAAFLVDRLSYFVSPGIEAA